MSTLGLRIRLANSLNRRSWTETFYYQLESGGIQSDEARAVIGLYARYRAGTLASNNVVADVTIWDTDFPRTTLIIPFNTPGSIGAGDSDPALSVQDLAPVSLKVSIRSATRNRQYLMRGLPDADFVQGSYQPSPAHEAKTGTWLQWLQFPRQRLQLAGRSSLTDNNIITQVTSDGISMQHNLSNPVAAGTLIAVTTNVAGNGPRVTTRVRSSGAAAVLQNGIPVKWKNGTCVGGKAEKLTFSYVGIESVTFDRAGRTRKTGGPLNRFRGRR